MGSMKTRGANLLRVGMLAAVVAVAACLGLPFAQTAHAADLGLVVAGGSAGVDYTYEDGVLTVTSETPLTISLAEDATSDRIVVNLGEGKTAHVTLDGVRIDASSLGKAALLVESGGLDLVLVVENSLKSGGGHAALQNGVSPLCISGDGKLVAQGSTAGIGGGSGDGSNITIKSGTVIAQGDGGAGIGGSWEGSGTNITISGGVVEATGGYISAGIGGGFNGSGSNITISGGKVMALGGEQAAGIGSGRGRGNGSNITIIDGEVTATGDSGGAGIGGGDCNNQPDCANGTDILIKGGRVIATGGDEGAGIGGGDGWSVDGFGGSGLRITIEGGDVRAEGGYLAAGIGGGSDNDGKGILIKGGEVAAVGGDEGAGIGGGFNGDGMEIVVSGGRVAATGGAYYAAGIGGGSGLDADFNPGAGGIGSGIVIKGGFIAATPGEDAQAIGSGYGAATREAPSITGGFFADSAKDWAGNTVYGVAPARGFAAVENLDADTLGAYPVRVIPEAALELVASARHIYDGKAPNASKLVAAARYGETDALGSTVFEHQEVGADAWEPGLPEAPGTYRVRGSLPEGCDADGARYAAATAEGALVIERAPLVLAITGDASKPCDGTADVPASHTLRLVVSGSLVDGDEVTASAASFAFDSPDAGAKGVVATGIALSGPDAGNYVAPATVSGEVAGGIAAVGGEAADAGAAGGRGEKLAGTGDPLGPSVLAALAAIAAAGAALRLARRR